MSIPCTLRGIDLYHTYVVRTYMHWTLILCTSSTIVDADVDWWRRGLKRARSLTKYISISIHVYSLRIITCLVVYKCEMCAAIHSFQREPRQNLYHHRLHIPPWCVLVATRSLHYNKHSHPWMWLHRRMLEMIKSMLHWISGFVFFGCMFARAYRQRCEKRARHRRRRRASANTQCVLMLMG